MVLSDNMRSAILMMGSMACFTFGDACIKALGDTLPLAQILVLRGIVATAFIALLARMMGQWSWDLPRADWGLVGLRSISEMGAAYFFLNALVNMPLANVTALLQMLPLTVTLGSALVFRETVGWRRWLAIGFGFVGMLLIVRPGTDGFSLYSVYALIAVVCVTFRDLLTRRMSQQTPSLMVTFFGSAVVLLFAGVWSFEQAWVPLSGNAAVLVLAASILIIGAYSLSVFVMRAGDVGFVAPFRYTGLLWALILGWFVFADWPDAMTLLGALIIVISGLFNLFRELSQPRQTQTG